MFEEYTSLTERGLACEEFVVPVGDRKITAMIASPAANRLDPDPVLLLTIGGQKTHLLPPNDQPAKFFWERGHRVVSFPIAFEMIVDDALRVRSPSSISKCNIAIETLRDNFIKGPDPFLTFIKEAKAVLKTCIDRNWARPGRVVVTGISRFAYLAFRLMAADDQLNIGGGFAPVTDWRDLSEFHEQRNLKEVADLRLSLFAEQLAGKKICLAIGNHDERVNTLSCCQFFMELNRENQKRGFDRTYVDFFCTLDPHHTCGDEWFERGMEILLNHAISKK